MITPDLFAWNILRIEAKLSSKDETEPSLVLKNARDVDVL